MRVLLILSECLLFLFCFAIILKYILNVVYFKWRLKREINYLLNYFQPEILFCHFIMRCESVKLNVGEINTTTQNLCLALNWKYRTGNTHRQTDIRGSSWSEEKYLKIKIGRPVEDDRLYPLKVLTVLRLSSLLQERQYFAESNFRVSGSQCGAISDIF